MSIGDWLPIIDQLWPNGVKESLCASCSLRLSMLVRYDPSCNMSVYSVRCSANNGYITTLHYDETAGGCNTYQAENVIT